ncbi:MAG TPA: GNAT family N-acetyltransferase [Candidatus Rubrimentiphilum sp.]|nr:GNAT family N-acetyltransferase [Candidatus Rubrimentiphilum sp.]
MSAGDEAAALDFLDAAPYENVFLSWAIASPLRPFAGASIYIYKDGPTVAGVAFFARHMVLAANTDAAIEAFAELARSNPNDAMIVGERGVVQRYWDRIRGWHAPPRLVRERQPLLAVDKAALELQPDATVAARLAKPNEWKIVADNSAAMIQEELEYDPRAGSRDFDESVRAAVARRTWWVGESAEGLCFFCNAGPRSSHTLQLQGIWTPPHLRRRGYGAAAMSQICGALLREVPTLSLYVNDFNAPALALYARLGFWKAGELSTLMF